MNLSVIICTYRRDAVLCDTLRSLFALADRSTEILVVDQSPEHDEATRTFLCDAVNTGKIRLLQQTIPSLTRARNVGAQQASGEVLVYLDDDVIPDPGLLDAYRAVFATGFNGAVAGQVLNEGQSPNQERGSFSSSLPEESFHQVYGANFALPRATYFAIGGSDENLGVHTYVEDRILSDRLRRHGYIIRYEPHASLVHLIAPRGGCRIGDESQKTKEWEKSFGYLYYLCHYHGLLGRGSASLWWVSLRSGPLRKNIICKPWRLPLALLGYLQAFLKAARLRPQRSPLQS